MASKNASCIRYCFTQTHVDPKDITCVHAAFKQLDPKKLLGVLLQDQLAWRIDPRLLTGSVRRHLLARTSSTLDLMYAFDPDISASFNRIIIPVQTFEYAGCGNGFTRKMRSVILDVSKTSAYSCRQADYALSIPEFLQKVNASEDNPSQFEAACITSSGTLIGTPWAHVLGHALWCPSHLTEYERYSLCASIFWVMTFNGFAETALDCRKADISFDDEDDARQDDAWFFEEQQIKMARLAELFNYNSLIDAMNASESLRRCA